MTPQQLLSRYVKAVTRTAQPGIYHLRYRTVASDGDVSISDWYEAGAKRALDYRVVAKQHGVRIARGRLSGRSWQQDANGLVLPNSEAPTVFDRALAAAANRPDQHVRVLGVTRAPPRRYVLQVAPNPRIVRRMYFDASTYRIAEESTQDYDKTVTTIRFFDYVWAGSKLVPSRETADSDLSSKSYDTTLLLRERLAYDPALLAIPRSRAPFVAQASLPATVNSIFSKYGILIRADIAGVPYWLKLDSGASDIVLDRDIARRLDIREFGKNATSKGGKLEEASAVVPRMDVGPLFATNLVVRTFPSADVEDGVHVVGLLGCDFIAGGPLAIDFQRQTVTVVTSPPPNGDGRWTSLRTPLHACRPVIHARLDGRPARLLLDFGSPDTVINEDVFASLGTTGSALDTKIVRFIGGEPLVGTEYALSRASAGGLELAPLVVMVVAGGRAQDLDDDGFIGRNVLDNYRVVLDYRDQRTYFRK